MNKRRKRSQVLELDDISDSCSAESSVEDDTFSVSFDQLDEEDSIPEYEEYLSESSVDSLDFERCESSSDEEKEVGVSERVGTEHVSDHEFYTEDEDSRDANCSQEPNTKLEDYRVLTYMNFVLSEGISVKTMQRMESLMTVLYNSPPPILYGEINKKLEDLKKEAVRSVSYYCHNCGTKKAGKKAGCSICSLSDNRLCETVTLIQCDYMKQIRSLLEEKGHEIVEAHRKIHSKKEMFESNDIRRYPGYQREVECRDDFTNHKINLVCTISSDGARFKRVSKREATPVLMRVEGVDMETRTGGKCMILIAMCYSDGGVKKNFVNVFVAKSLQELPSLKIDVKLDGISYQFNFQLLGYLADMKEQLSLVGLPNWHKEDGCSKCRTRGQKQPKKNNISFNDSYSAPLRDDDSLRWAAENGTEGFSQKGIPRFYELFSPTKVTIDPFHIRGAGICKYLIEEILTPNRCSFRLKRGVLDRILKSIQEIKCYTHDTIQVLNARKMGKATGREIDKLCIYMCALIGTTESCESGDQSVFFFGMYHCLQFLGSRMSNTGSLRELLDNVYDLLVFLWPKNVTIKWHTFFKHLQDHEENYGVLYTTEPFEREHKNFMTSVHYQATNSEFALISRYVGQQLYQRKMRQLISLMESSTVTRVQSTLKMRPHKQFDALSLNNVVQREEIKPDHVTMLEESLKITQWKCLKRVQVETLIGKFYFSSKYYWKNKRTTSSQLCFLDPTSGNVAFGHIEFIFASPTSINFLVVELEVDSYSFFLTLDSHPLCNLARKVVESCKKFPTSFAKITGSHYSVVPLNSALCPFTIVNFDHQFLRNPLILSIPPQTLLELFFENGIYQFSVQMQKEIFDMDNKKISNIQYASISAPPITQFVDGNHQNFPNPSQQEQFFANTPGHQNHIFHNQVTARPTPPPSAGPPPFSLKEELTNCVSGNSLNLYEAGDAIHKAYSMQMQYVSRDISEFVKKHCKTVTNLKNPDFFDASHYANQQALMHGYGLMARFSHEACLQQPLPTVQPQTSVENQDFNRLTGAAFNVKKDYFYPNAAPFSGKQIDLAILPNIEGKTHVRLKHFLFKLLSVSCTRQSDIQRAWLLPGEKVHNFLHLTPFPEELYNDLKEIFLVYFELDPPELEIKQFRAEFADLKFLSHYTDIEMKKKIFKQRSSARYSYVFGTFHKQIKAALRELKDSVYTAGPTPGSGNFQFRKRGGSKLAMSGPAQKKKSTTPVELNETVHEEDDLFNEGNDD